MADLTLGLVELGSIGARVAKVAKAFSRRTIAWSQNLTSERAAEHGVERVDRDVMFRTADVVSLQMRLSDRTEGMITKADFDLMKPTAYFINTFRGGLVNEAELIDTLRNKRIAGAGLDVSRTLRPSRRASLFVS